MFKKPARQRRTARRSSRKQGGKLGRPQLSIEPLETRQMMAGDLGVRYALTPVQAIDEGGAKFVVESIVITGTSGDDEAEVYYLDSNIHVHTRAPGREWQRSTLIKGPGIGFDVSNTVVIFDGKAGNDSFINLTTLATNANGGDGDDRLTGGFGRNTLIGGSGNDTLVGQQTLKFKTGPYDGLHQIFHGGAGNDTIRGTNANDLITGGDGDDVIRSFAGNDLVWGDFYDGGSGHDYINAGGGDDELWGGAGNDRLYGELGLDVLVAGAGRDYLDGGNDAVRDSMFGGTGPDTFVVRNDALDNWFDKTSLEGDSSYILTPLGNGQYQYPARPEWLEMSVNNLAIRGSSGWSFASGANSAGTAASTYQSNPYMYAGAGAAGLYVTNYGDGDLGALVLASAAANPTWLATNDTPNAVIDPRVNRDFAHLDQAFAQVYGLSLKSRAAMTLDSTGEGSLAYVLDRSLGLAAAPGGYALNWGGKNEKWLMGNDGWYFIVPTGSLYKWNGGSGANGTLVAELAANFYADPTLLHEAHGRQTMAQLATELDRQLGLSLAPSGAAQNWGGKNEKWLMGKDGWYFILPTGQLYQWNGGSTAEGRLVATLDASYWNDLGRLYSAAI